MSLPRYVDLGFTWYLDATRRVFWFRLSHNRKGLLVKDVATSPLTFSQRNGYARGRLFGRVWVELLASILVLFVTGCSTPRPVAICACSHPHEAYQRVTPRVMEAIDAEDVTHKFLVVNGHEHADNLWIKVKPELYEGKQW